MTPEQLTEIEARAHAATPLADTGHSQMCSYAECSAVWVRAAWLSQARAASVADVLALVAEVRQYRGLYDSAVGGRGDFRNAYRRERYSLSRAHTIIRKLLASATPHPVEHPTMAEAWAEARLYLGEYGDDQ